MKLFVKFIATIGIIWFAVIIAFGYWWDSSQTLSYKEAVDVLETSTTAQKREVKKLCQEMMSTSHESSQILHYSEIQSPPIPFYSISVNPSSCHLFLYKNPGKGIGFAVTLNKDNMYELYQFNDYSSWERHPVEL